IHRNLEGIRKMTRLPGALFVVDVKHEHIALREARKLGIPTICLIDTDGDPEWADVVIPGNDDAMRAVSLICQHVADAVEEGKRSRPPESGPQDRAEGGPGPEGGPAERAPRRPRRMTTTQRFEPPAEASPTGGDGASGESATTPDTESPLDASSILPESVAGASR